VETDLNLTSRGFLDRDLRLDMSDDDEVMEIYDEEVVRTWRDGILVFFH
jgi:hypothetical protein